VIGRRRELEITAIGSAHRERRGSDPEPVVALLIGGNTTVLTARDATRVTTALKKAVTEARQDVTREKAKDRRAAGNR
jgi:hypothetical protein